MCLTGETPQNTPVTKKKVSRYRRRKRSITGSQTDAQDPSRVGNPDSNKSDTSVAKNLVMGQVEIVKCDEPLPDVKTKEQTPAKTLKKGEYGGRRGKPLPDVKTKEQTPAKTLKKGEYGGRRGKPLPDVKTKEQAPAKPLKNGEFGGRRCKALPNVKADKLAPAKTLKKGEFGGRHGKPLPDVKSNKQTPAKTVKKGEIGRKRLPDLKSKKKATTVTLKKSGVGGRREDDDLISCSMQWWGPEPETVQKHIKASNFYAGSCNMGASPPPSSLPLPAFPSKKGKKIYDANSDLFRRLATLNLLWMTIVIGLNGRVA